MGLRKRFSRDRSTYVWMIDYYDATGQRVRQSANTANRKVAERVLKKKLEEVALQRAGVGRPEQSKAPLITIIQFKKVYEEYLIANQREPSTVDLYCRALETLHEVLGDVLLTEIIPRDIERWKSESLQLRSATSVNIHQRALQSSLNTAKKLGYLKVNPLDSVELIAPSSDNDVPKVFETEQLETIFSAIKEPWLLAMIKTYLYTGMRREECIHLEVDDFDFERLELHIRNKPRLNWKTKTKKNRIIPISTALEEVLLGMKKDGLFPNEGLVFHARRAPHGIMNGKWLGRKFKKYVTDCGYGEDLTLHNLRHTFATRLLQRSASLFAVSKLLGHASVKTTERYYAHAIPTDFRREADLIDI